MADDQVNPQAKRAAQGGRINPANQKLAQEIPTEKQQSAEWGERLSTGKTIASGGREDAGPKGES